MLQQHKDLKAAKERLLKAGFTQAQIDRLISFCKSFIIGEMDQTSSEHRRLEFFRWLVATGRLTDQTC